MKIYIFLILATTMCSCVYKSLILTNTNKDNVISGLGVDYDITKQKLDHSILTNKVDFDFLQRIDGNSDIGGFNLFIVNNNTYLEARSTKITKDSITLNGVILYKNKRDTIHFDFTYRDRSYDQQLLKISFDTYQLNIIFKTSDASFLSDNNGSTQTYLINKSENFIIQDNTLELLTGEIQRIGKNRSKFIVINDPTKPKYYLTSIALLEFYLVTEKGIEDFSRQCKDKNIIKCAKKYSIQQPKYAWTEFQIICKCKD